MKAFKEIEIVPPPQSYRHGQLQAYRDHSILPEDRGRYKERLG